MNTLAGTIHRRTLCAALTLALVGCGDSDATPAASTSAATSARAATPRRDAINPRLLRRFAPVARLGAEPPATTPAMVDLGRMLWYETRLSRDHDITCDSCHALASYGVDGRRTSRGHHGQAGRRNAPTVYNASEHFALFWDGRANTAEQQATGPIVNPVEMAMTEADVVARLREVPEYATRFHDAFPDEAAPITLANVGRALGAFERGLTTHARWDDYLAGHADALQPREVEGLRVFLNVGCMGCHTGPQVGASMYQVAGAVEPWPRREDLGRFEVTHAPTDRMVFKVPTLRNIERTAPYFHDGTGPDLPTAVRMMGRHQLGIELSAAEVASLVAFLGAFTGEIPAAYIARPAMPADPDAQGESADAGP